MKAHWLLFLLLLLLPTGGLADKSTAAQQLGSEAAARHLMTHLSSATAGVTLPEPGNTVLVCCGSRVSMWDTPMKGSHTGHLYPGSKVGTLEKNSEFELCQVENYNGKFYAMVRIYKDGYVRGSGWVLSDYVQCTCTDFTAQEDVPVYGGTSLTFDLR